MAKSNHDDPVHSDVTTENENLSQLSTADVEKLKELLRQESRCHQETGHCYDTLQREYDDLLKKYAEAENTIDKLRVGVRINLYSDKPKPHKIEYNRLEESRSKSVQQINLNSNPQHGRLRTYSLPPVYDSDGNQNINDDGNSLYLKWLENLRDLESDVSAFEEVLVVGDYEFEEQQQLYNAMQKDFNSLAEELKDIKDGTKSQISKSLRLGDNVVETDDLEGELYRLGLRLEEIHEEITEQANRKDLAFNLKYYGNSADNAATNTSKKEDLHDENLDTSDKEKLEEGRPEISDMDRSNSWSTVKSNEDEVFPTEENQKSYSASKKSNVNQHASSTSSSPSGYEFREEQTSPNNSNLRNFRERYLSQSQQPCFDSPEKKDIDKVKNGKSPKDHQVLDGRSKSRRNDKTSERHNKGSRKNSKEKEKLPGKTFLTENKGNGDNRQNVMNSTEDSGFMDDRTERNGYFEKDHGHSSKTPFGNISGTLDGQMVCSQKCRHTRQCKNRNAPNISLSSGSSQRIFTPTHNLNSLHDTNASCYLNSSHMSSFQHKSNSVLIQSDASIPDAQTQEVPDENLRHRFDSSRNIPNSKQNCSITSDASVKRSPSSRRKNTPRSWVRSSSRKTTTTQNLVQPNEQSLGSSCHQKSQGHHRRSLSLGSYLVDWVSSPETKLMEQGMRYPSHSLDALHEEINGIRGMIVDMRSSVDKSKQSRNRSNKYRSNRYSIEKIDSFQGRVNKRNVGTITEPTEASRDTTSDSDDSASSGSRSSSDRINQIQLLTSLHEKLDGLTNTYKNLNHKKTRSKRREPSALTKNGIVNDNGNHKPNAEHENQLKLLETLTDRIEFLSTKLKNENEAISKTPTMAENSTEFIQKIEDKLDELNNNFKLTVPKEITDAPVSLYVREATSERVSNRNRHKPICSTCKDQNSHVHQEHLNHRVDDSEEVFDDFKVFRQKNRSPQTDHPRHGASSPYIVQTPPRDNYPHPASAQSQYQVTPTMQSQYPVQPTSQEPQGVGKNHQPNFNAHLQYPFAPAMHMAHSPSPKLHQLYHTATINHPSYQPPHYQSTPYVAPNERQQEVNHVLQSIEPTVFHHIHSIEESKKTSKKNKHTNQSSSNSKHERNISLHDAVIENSLRNASVAAYNMETMSKRLLRSITTDLLNSGASEF